MERTSQISTASNATNPQHPNHHQFSENNQILVSQLQLVPTPKWRLVPKPNNLAQQLSPKTRTQTTLPHFFQYCHNKDSSNHILNP